MTQIQQDLWAYNEAPASGVVMVMMSVALILAVIIAAISKIMCCGQEKDTESLHDYEDMTVGEEGLSKRIPSVPPASARYHDVPLTHSVTTITCTPQAEYEVPVPLHNPPPQLPRREYLNDTEFVQSLPNYDNDRTAAVGVSDMGKSEGAISKPIEKCCLESEWQTENRSNLQELEPENRVYQPLIPPRLMGEEQTDLEYEVVECGTGNETTNQDDDDNQSDYEPVCDYKH